MSQVESEKGLRGVSQVESEKGFRGVSGGLGYQGGLDVSLSGGNKNVRTARVLSEVFCLYAWPS